VFYSLFEKRSCISELCVSKGGKRGRRLAARSRGRLLEKGGWLRFVCSKKADVALEGSEGGTSLWGFSKKGEGQRKDRMPTTV